MPLANKLCNKNTLNGKKLMLNKTILYLSMVGLYDLIKDVKNEKKNYH